jgi:hypothetical protein
MQKRGVLLSLGPLLVILGGCPLLYIYAFASMVPPELAGWDFWSLVLSKMFDFSDAGWISLLSSGVVVAGSALFVWGVAVVIGDALRFASGRLRGQ